MSSYPEPNTLFSRQLVARDDSNSSFTCARPKANEHRELLSIGITFESFMTFFTAACLCLTAVSTIVMTLKHLRRYTIPKEQRQIVRIIFMPLFVCIIGRLSVLFEEKSIYLKAIMQV